MNSYEKINLAIGVINALVITIALVYYYRQANAAKEQVKLLRATLDRGTYIDFEASLFELSKLLIQHPIVRPYLYSNKPPLAKDDHNYDLVISFCVFYLDFFDHVFTTEKLSPGGTKWGSENWSNWIQDMLKASPSLRNVLNDERHWYDEGLFKLLEKVEAELNIRSSTPVHAN